MIEDERGWCYMLGSGLGMAGLANFETELNSRILKSGGPIESHPAWPDQPEPRSQCYAGTCLLHTFCQSAPHLPGFIPDGLCCSPIAQSYPTQCRESSRQGRRIHSAKCAKQLWVKLLLLSSLVLHVFQKIEIIDNSWKPIPCAFVVRL